MRLLTHNFLACHAVGCRDLTSATHIQNAVDSGRRTNYPLRLSKVTLEEREADFNPEFIRRMSGRVIWSVFARTARDLGNEDVPLEEPSDEQWRDDVFCQKIHRVLLEVKLHVVNGIMTCPACQHVYPIKDGIPNMLLGPDEV